MKSPVPSLKDVAKHAGVSPMTISRVINGSGPVSEQMRDRVLRAMEKLGVRRDRYASIAANKRGGRDQRRLVVVDTAHEDSDGGSDFAFYARIAMTTLTRLSAAGHRTALTNLMLGVDRHLDELVDADAVIYCSPVSPDVHQRITAINRDMLSVSICHRQHGASLIGPDDYAGGTLAAEQAAATGRNEVLILTSNKQDSYATRTRAFIERLQSLRPGIHIRIVDYPLLSDGVHASSAVILGMLADAWNGAAGSTALAFGVGGYATLMLYRFLSQRSLRIPDDVALLGFDAMPFYEHLPIGIDRIEFNVAALGHLAVDDLLRRFGREGGADPVTSLVPCVHVTGASLSCASSELPASTI